MTEINTKECYIFSFLGYGIIILLWFMSKDILFYYYMISTFSCIFIYLFEGVMKGEYSKTITENIMGWFMSILLVCSVSPVLTLWYPYRLINMLIQRLIKWYIGKLTNKVVNNFLKEMVKGDVNGIENRNNESVKKNN